MQKRKSVPKCSKTKKLSHILIFFFSKTLRIETLPGFFLRSDAKQKFMQLLCAESSMFVETQMILLSSDQTIQLIQNQFSDMQV